MLVLTVQKKSIAQKMLSGEYKANFWKSDFACVSPNYTRGYAVLSREVSLVEEGYIDGVDSPVWFWAGIPFLGFYRGYVGEPLVAVFMDVPVERLVFSDYSGFEAYVNGSSGCMDFMISRCDVRGKIREGCCVQACAGRVSPGNIVMCTAFSELPVGVDMSVSELYIHSILLGAYKGLRTGYLKGVS